MTETKSTFPEPLPGFDPEVYAALVQEQLDAIEGLRKLRAKSRTIAGIATKGIDFATLVRDYIKLDAAAGAAAESTLSMWAYIQDRTNPNEGVTVRARLDTDGKTHIEALRGMTAGPGMAMVLGAAIDGLTSPLPTKPKRKRRKSGGMRESGV